MTYLSHCPPKKGYKLSCCVYGGGEKACGKKIRSKRKSRSPGGYGPNCWYVKKGRLSKKNCCGDIWSSECFHKKCSKRKRRRSKKNEK